MSGAKSYTRAQWDEFIHAPEALPEKARSERRVTVSDAMKEIRGHITATQAKGYTLEEIVHEAGRKGLDVSIGAVKYALYRPESSDAAYRTDNSPGGSEGGSSTRPRKTARRKGAHVSNAHDAARHRTGKSVNQAGSMEIQDTFSFEIRPDIKNL